MSTTKDGLRDVRGKLFEVVHGVEGDCLVLGDEDGGTRISGPKPWGGGQVIKAFRVDEEYGPTERLEDANAKLRDLVRRMWSCYGYEEQGCATCYYYGCNECEPMWDACKWESQMIDLGVEIEGS